MVKGVNKRVIEVNNTGNKFFEKIVFYVAPEYGNLSAEQLYNAADYLSLNLRESALKPPTLRKKRRKRKLRAVLALSVGILLVCGVVLTVIL